MKIKYSLLLFGLVILLSGCNNQSDVIDSNFGTGNSSESEIYIYSIDIESSVSLK